jgi:hypothetical protein
LNSYTIPRRFKKYPLFWGYFWGYFLS